MATAAQIMGEMLKAKARMDAAAPVADRIMVGPDTDFSSRLHMADRVNQVINGSHQIHGLPIISDARIPLDVVCIMCGTKLLKVVAMTEKAQGAARLVAMAFELGNEALGGLNP